jgi:Ser/Thr protein kinase RdoA (MazF antagonist)
VSTPIEEILELVPELTGAESVSELAGGLTNTNYKVEVDGRAYVVRISAKDAGLLAIDRENEHQNSVAAAEVGVGAPVVAYLPERSVLVL